MEEDPTFKVELNPETKQNHHFRNWDQHLDLILSKLKSKFKVEVDLTNPKVAYRETIKKKSR